MTRFLLSLTFVFSLTACGSIDKERATEQRMQELCREISTRNLSHCAGNHIPPPPLHPDANPAGDEN